MYVTFITVMLSVGIIACYVFFQVLKNCIEKGTCFTCSKCLKPEN